MKWILNWRVIATALSITLAGILVLLAWHPWPRNNWNDGFWDSFFLNLGTEIIGIVITVGFIEILLERQRNEDEAKRIAWEALHELDYAIWVWQGGRRRFELYELNNHLKNAKLTDPLPSFTLNLFFVIGSRSENTLRISAKEIKVNKKLKEALEILSDLTDLGSGTEISKGFNFIFCLINASEKLAGVLNLPLIDSRYSMDIISTNDCSVERQKVRYYGER